MEELQKKLSNWGHNEDFDVESFLKIWDALDENNYQLLRRFSPGLPQGMAGLTPV